MTITKSKEIDINRDHGYSVHYEPEALLRANLQWTRLFLAFALSALLLSLGITASSWKAAKHQRLLVLAPSGNGSLVPVDSVDASAYRPQQKVIEYFAISFVAKYYSRIRYTIGQDYLDSLQFLDPDHRKSELAREKQTHWIEAFQNDPTAPEIRITVTKIRFGNCQGTECQLSVDFDKHFVVHGVEQADKTENWTADIAYTVSPSDLIDNDLVPVNPIGIVLGEIREAKGFRQ